MASSLGLETSPAVEHPWSDWDTLEAKSEGDDRSLSGFRLELE
jgi:hypothetical protein